MRRFAMGAVLTIGTVLGVLAPAAGTAAWADGPEHVKSPFTFEDRFRAGEFCDFAYIAPDAAQRMADAGVVLVGVDYISAEQFGSPAPLAHRTLLGKGIPIVEGLALANVPAGDYDLIVLPMKVGGHEGAPARAVLRRRPP